MQRAEIERKAGEKCKTEGVTRAESVSFLSHFGLNLRFTRMLGAKAATEAKKRTRRITENIFGVESACKNWILLQAQQIFFPNPKPGGIFISPRDSRTRPFLRWIATGGNQSQDTVRHRF
jgi:hypothetical protein